MKKTNRYTELLEEKVAEIRKICIQEKIPCFLTFATEDDGKKTHYINEMVSPELVDQPLSQDHIADHVGIINGFFTANKPLEEGDPDMYTLHIPKEDIPLW